MRQSVMSAGDQDALWAWLQTTSGTTDLAAWQRLLANLPFADPRRSLAASRIARCAPTLRATANLRPRRACNACVTPTRRGVVTVESLEWGRQGATDQEREEPDLCRVIPHASSRTRPSLRPAAASARRERCCASSRSCCNSPSGVRADEVAKELGKSVSTAYYLLTSLCEEGFAVHESKGVYRRARGLEQLTAAVGEHTHPAPAPRRPGRHVSTSCFCAPASARTSAWSAPAGSRSSPSAAARGSRGCPGLGSEIRDSAHALAMGKVVLSLLGAQTRWHATSPGA